jgi:Flp pilus assembly protein TadB
MDESKLMIIQLLQALDNGEVNFKQVPALVNLVKAETQRQVQAQADDVVDELGKQCQTSLMMFEQDQKQRIASQRQTLRDLNQEIKETQLKLEKSTLQRTITIIVMVMGIITLLATLGLLMWVIVPMVLHGSGLKSIWDTWHPELTGWGAVRCIGAILTSFLVICIELLVIGLPTVIAIKIMEFVDKSDR